MSQYAPAILRHLVDPAVRALVVATVAAVILRLLRVKRTSIRLGMWTGVLYAAFAMPLLGTLLPALPLRLPVGQSALELPAQPQLPPAASSSAPLELSPSAFDRVRAPVTRTASTPRHPISWELVALGAYTLVAGFLLGRLALGLLLAGRLLRDSQPIRSPAVRLTLETKARALGLKHGATVAQSGAVTVPVTVGVLDPAILLPGDWPEWEKTKLAAALAHELAHVKRRDGLTRLISRIYVCLFWFSPLAWWLDRHLAELAEQVSDQQAIVAGADPAQYAEVLMSFFAAVNQVRGRVRLYGISMAHGSRAGSRIENVLATPVAAPAKLRRPLLVVIAVCATVTVGLVAALHPVRANAQLAEQQPPSVAAGQRGTWTFSSGQGMDFAIVSGGSMTMNGSEDDRAEVESLRTKIHGDFIWFIHDGNSYVIRDAAMVKTARQLYEPMEALGRRQETLGRRQEALGKQQEDLGRQMEAIKVKVPDNLEAKLESLEATVRKLGSTGSQRQLAELQDQIGQLQSEIGSVQSNAGMAEAVLGRQQGELGRRQGRLGEQQGSLGREQGRLARQASRKMQTILQQALSTGSAKRVP